jgi:accessory colonization factor AcfC
MKYYRIRRIDKSEDPIYFRGKEITKEQIIKQVGESYTVDTIDKFAYDAGELIVQQGFQQYIDLISDLSKEGIV